MNLEEAKNILQTYRPGGEDFGDSMFAEALALSRSDPELAIWLEEQIRLDAAISRRLKQFTAPAELRAQILETAARRNVPRRQWAWKLAACLAGLGLAAGLWLSRFTSEPESDFAAYREDMAEFLQEFPVLDVETERLAEMREWLSRRHSLVRATIPAGLERFPGIGCRTVEWRGKELALLCFMVSGEVVHLFVIHPSAFLANLQVESPQFARVHDMTTASWEKDGVAYLALTKGNEGFLRKHL